MNQNLTHRKNFRLKILFGILAGLVLATIFVFANPTQKTIIETPLEQGNLVGYWNMDANDIFATTVYDKSGNKNDGTIYGATTTEGRLKEALYFDGDDYVEVPDSDSLDLTDAGTIELWLYVPE